MLISQIQAFQILASNCKSRQYGKCKTGDLRDTPVRSTSVGIDEEDKGCAKGKRAAVQTQASPRPFSPHSSSTRRLIHKAFIVPSVKLLLAHETRVAASVTFLQAAARPWNTAGSAEWPILI